MSEKKPILVHNLILQEDGRFTLDYSYKGVRKQMKDFAVCFNGAIHEGEDFYLEAYFEKVKMLDSTETV